MSRTIALVEHGILQPAGDRSAPIAVGSAAWYAWLDEARSFVFVQGAARFTAHKERFQRGSCYWRAYRRRGGSLRRVYLGKAEALTLAQLAAALERLCGAGDTATPYIAPEQHPPAAASVAQLRRESQQQPDAALRRAIESRDTAAAAQLIEAHAAEWFARGAAPAVSAWLEALPELLDGGRPRLLLIYVRARLLAGAWEGVEARLRVLGTSDAVEAHVLRAACALLRGQIDESTRLAEDAARRIEPADVLAHSMNEMTLAAVAWVRGQTHTALRHVSGARSAGSFAQYTDLALIALSHEALFLMRSGRLHAAQARYSRVLLTVDRSPHRDLPATGIACLGFGRLLYERNLLPQAAEQLQRAVGYGRRRESAGLIAGGLAGMARVLQAQGDPVAAAELLDQAEQQLAGAAFEQFGLYVAAGRAWLALEQGNTAAAVASLEQYDLHEHGYLAAQAESARLALAHLRLQQQRPVDALELLAALRQAAEQADRRGSLVGIRAAEALAYEALGRADEAVAAVRDVLPHAQDQGYVRSFVDAGLGLRFVLRRARVGSSAGPYVETLLAAFASGSFELDPPCQAQALTRRELDVLSLVAMGASNDEIADRLCFSVSNVKKRLHSIFRKLNVRRRTQAVARARELRLI